MAKVRKKISFKGKKIYVGIDVHKKQWTICICTEHTNYRPFSMEPDPQILINYLKKNFPGGQYTCAYEAGFSGFVLYEALWESFIECLVIHPADIPTSHKETQFKTDSRDALKIAKSLRAGQLQSIHIPDKLLQQERSLVRTRQQLTADLVRYKCRVKSLLAFYNISIPEQFQKANWNNDMRGWLWDLEFPCDIGAKSIRFLMSMLEYTRAMRLNIDTHLGELARSTRYEQQVELLTSVCGFATIRAIKFLVEIGDIKRFPNMDKLACFVGLVPASSNSGNKVIQKELTVRGHKHLRTMLIEAAWVAIGTDPAMAHKYAQLKKRMLAQQAIVAVARSLLARIRFVLINKVKYQKGIIN